MGCCFGEGSCQEGDQSLTRDGRVTGVRLRLAVLAASQFPAHPVEDPEMFDPSPTADSIWVSVSGARRGLNSHRPFSLVVLKPVCHFKPLNEYGGFGSGHRQRNYFQGSRTGSHGLGLHGEAVGDMG